MTKFPSIDEVHDILNEIAEEIPEELYKDLNEGIVLLPGYKLHPESRREDRLYVMGEYSRSITGRNIKIYYGSFKRVYRNASIEVLREKLRETLFHEFTHHIESLAGVRDLEIEDSIKLERYKERGY